MGANMFQADTIAAIATSSVSGGISVIRLSGEDALSIADKIFKSKKENKKLSEQKSHTLHYGYICDGERVIDEVIVLLMLSPNSYTKEDVVEIDCHGGKMASKLILERLIQSGARMAEPGEFTKRAFLNGRIDLSQAEAVADIIQSKNKYALEASVSQLRGSIRERITEIRNEILRDIAFIEAALDDPEHMSLDGFSAQLDKKTDKYLESLNHILANSENGRILKEGVRTVILGKPNVGKSSIMNLLLKEDRAIVTNIPGTTRDVLEEEVQIGNVTLRIMDTAGIRETSDIIEKMGIEKAKTLLEKADFVILVFDRSEPLSNDDREIMEWTNNIPGVILLNKSDLLYQVEKKEIAASTDKKIIDFSVKDKKGLHELEEYIQKLFYEDKISYDDEIYISSLRQKEALLESVQSLKQVRVSIDSGMSEDFYTIDLTNSYEALGKIIGETVEDDVVDTIFREFCMGK